MIGIDALAPWDKQRPLGLYNGGSAEIPAFGCYEIYDSYRPDSGEAMVLGGGRTVLKVRQPTADNVANFGINGPIPLPAGQSDGFGTQDYPTYAAYDTTNTPAFGEEWGPQAGSCLIKKGNRGLVIYGDPNGTIARVARSASDTNVSAVAHPESTILGSDGSGSEIISDAIPFTNLTTGYAKIYAPVANGASYRFDRISSGTPIINGTPFKLTVNDLLSVRKHNGVWWVERFWHGGPCWSSQLGGSYAASNVVTFASPWEDVGGCWERNSLSGISNGKLTFMCPGVGYSGLGLKWLVNLSVNVIAQMYPSGSYALGIDMTYNHHDSSGTLMRQLTNGVSTHQTSTDVSTNTRKWCISLTTIDTFREGDFFYPYFTYNGLGGTATFSGQVSLTPILT